MDKETISMKKTLMKAVGAGAAGRNRKVHMRIASVTIYCDEGSKGSNPALPLKPPKGGFLIVPETLIVLTKALFRENLRKLLP